MALARLRDLLGRNGEAHWAGIVARALGEPDDAALARSVRGWTSGKGALSGLTISPTNGHAVQTCAVDSVNRTLAELRSQVQRLANEIPARSIPIRS
jgi:hypothetical protein